LKNTYSNQKKKGKKSHLFATKHSLIVPINTIPIIKTPIHQDRRFLLTVGMGFERHEEANPLPVFKTGAFNRSATPP
jgi:hypothetical protein